MITCMIAFVKLGRDNVGNDPRKYYCSKCGALVATSAELAKLNGADQHSFINPAGILCNFMTFSHCENVVVHEDLFFEHSWFVGYGWRFLLCCTCFQHLGWKYDALRSTMSPESFFGVLVNVVETCPAGE